MDKSTKFLQQRGQYEKILAENAQVANREEAVEYAKALMHLIFDCKMVGYIYEYYADNVLFKTADGRCIHNKDGVTNEAMFWLGAFTDFTLHFEESFASGDFTEEFKVYQRYFCCGTNNGPSIYGGPTYEKIDASNCRGESLFVFRNVEGRWKVTTEYTIRSNYFVERLIREHQPEVPTPPVEEIVPEMSALAEGMLGKEAM